MIFLCSMILFSYLFFFFVIIFIFLAFFLGQRVCPPFFPNIIGIDPPTPLFQSESLLGDQSSQSISFFSFIIIIIIIIITIIIILKKKIGFLFSFFFPF